MSNRKRQSVGFVRFSTRRVRSDAGKARNTTAAGCTPSVCLCVARSLGTGPTHHIPHNKALGCNCQRHASKPTTCTSCPNCRIQADQILALKAQVEAHENERQSWKAFKTWWLDSLTKKEKKRGRNTNLGAANHLPLLQRRSLLLVKREM